MGQGRVDVRGGGGSGRSRSRCGRLEGGWAAGSCWGGCQGAVLGGGEGWGDAWGDAGLLDSVTGGVVQARGTGSARAAVPKCCWRT